MDQQSSLARDALWSSRFWLLLLLLLRRLLLFLLEDVMVADKIGGGGSDFLFATEGRDEQLTLLSPAAPSGLGKLTLLLLLYEAVAAPDSTFGARAVGTIK